MAGFNPFLAQAEFQPAPQYIPPEPQMPAANPFLSFGAPEPTSQPDNPFLSFSQAAPAPYEQPASTYAEAGGAINPFMDFVSSSAPLPASTYTAPMPASVYQAPPPASIYQAPPPASTYAAPTQTTQIYSTYQTISQTTVNQWPPPPEPMVSLVDTSEDYPPKTQLPDSTQNLIHQMTGALEATTNILDRLATSPVPPDAMEATTPSPGRTPSPPDLWGGDETSSTGNTLPAAPPSSANPLNPSPTPLLDLFDTPQSKTKTPFEILDLYNAAPIQPPSKPAEIVSPKTGSVPPLIDASLPVEKRPSVGEIPVQPVAAEIVSPREEEMRETDLITPMDELPPQQQQHPPVPTVTEPVQQSMPAFAPARPPVPEGSPAKKPERPKPPMPPPPARSPVQEVKTFEPVMSPEQVSSPPMAKSPIQEIRSPIHEAVSPPQPKSPVQESKPTPSRPPPPPVPPAPRAQMPPQPPVITQPPPAPFQQPPAPVPSPFQAPAPVHYEQAAPQPTATSSFFTGGNTATSAYFTGGNTYTEPEASEVTQGSAFFSSTITGSDAFAPPTAVAPKSAAFDDFDSKFESTGTSSGSAFGDAFGGGASTAAGDDAWGSGGGASGTEMGFGNEEGFDSFLSLTEPPPVPQSTPAKSMKQDSEDFEGGDTEICKSVKIRPRGENELSFGIAPALAPPPKSPAALSQSSAYSGEETTFVPFLSSASAEPNYAAAKEQTTLQRTDSSESPQEPLFEEDTSQPLEDFPRVTYHGEGWQMEMRHPNKKKLGQNRFWKKVFVKVAHQNDVAIVQIYNKKGDRDPIQEIPLQPCYSVSEIAAQQYDQFGKLFTLKVQYVYYKERPGIRPGQISKGERITNKLSAFAKSAFQGDYDGVKEFGSDLKKLGSPIEHAPQISQLVKLGTQNYEDLKQFSAHIEENLFKLNIHRDRALVYKTEEIQVTLVDEYYTEIDIYGIVTRQIARVRLFFLSFLSGSGDIEMGLNDLRRQGTEVVGRHDIIPVATEEWIRVENIELANCINLDEYDKTQTLKFKAPDACYFELLRFRVRPPKQRELPLQVKTVFTTTGQKVEIRSDILVPGFTSRKLGQIPCEDVMIKIPIPEAWLYMFRVEKHFRYGSVKSAHRRSGKVKGIERFLGAVDQVEPSLMETTSGQAKYEHHHRAIVWRIPRLPKEGQGAYTTHSFFCHVQMQPHEKMPDDLKTIAKHAYVEFTMPHTVVSHTVCRSISCPGCDEPPEKCVKYLTRNEYIVEIEHTEQVAQASYNLAAAVTKKPEPKPEPVPETTNNNNQKEEDSDFSD